MPGEDSFLDKFFFGRQVSRLPAFLGTLLRNNGHLWVIVNFKNLHCFFAKIVIY